MRGLSARWKMRAGETVIDGAAPSDGLEPLVARVLAVRGLTDPNIARAFLDPKLNELIEPSLIPDVDRAAERLLRAACDGEPIVIYGDYDVDGITATSILYHMIRHLAPGARVTTYVPHRMEEGYGLNCEAVRALAAAGARVIVSVDCGITSHEPARTAREVGVDLIITDHHNPPARMEDLPEAYAVAHPRRPDSTYPFGELCGAGVAYKVAWRLATMSAGGSRVDPTTRRLLVELLTYAALGAIADVVPLVGENRVITKHGLERIKYVGRDGVFDHVFRGLRALVDASGLDGEKVDTYDVGFRLAPRLNASGRMGHAKAAVELFTTADDSRSAQIAAHLTKQNDERRAVEREIFEQACEMVEQRGMHHEGRRAIVLTDERWHAGVVGIVCSRLVERYGRPSILLHRDGEDCHGSGRSIDGFNLHAALCSCSHLLDRFGGHDMAAGMGLKHARFDSFVEAFIAEANARIPVEHLTPAVSVDCEATMHELTPRAVEQLQMLGPFGRGNPTVRVLVRNARLASNPRPMGAHAKHLSLEVADADRRMRVVCWGWGDRSDKLRAGALTDLVVEPKISTWNGRVNVEPVLADLRVV